MKLRFVYILGLSATILSCTAAYFSIIGMANLFVGAFWPIVIMIGGLEFAKLVTASYLYRYWNDITTAFKSYLIIGVITIMVITSAGVYGFLSSAYSHTFIKVNKIDRQIQFLENKKSIFQNEIDRLAIVIRDKNARINTINSVRLSQENRIDSLYANNRINGVRRTESIIKESNIEAFNISEEINQLNKNIQINTDSINVINLQILSQKDIDIGSEANSLKYIAELTGKDVNTVVNFFIFLLIFVFDPLAVCLVIATNRVLLNDKKKDQMGIKNNDNGDLLLKTILQKYCDVFKQASIDDIVFDNFKSHPDVQVVLEHTTKELGQKHLKSIEQNNPWLFDISTIFDNDKYGSPKLEEFVLQSGKTIKCSPTTLQYINVLSNLINEFKHLSEYKIVEIGAGYGGQCKIIQDVFDIQQYVLIDLYEVGLLQQKYLSKFKHMNFEIFTNENYPVNNQYDLVISNYALSELSPEDQLKYVKDICLKSEHGYITCNNYVSGTELLKEKFSTFKTIKDIEGERSTNYIMIW